MTMAKKERTTIEESSGDASPEGKRNWVRFDRMLERVRARFTDLAPDEIQALIDEAVRETRKEMWEERQRA